MFGNCRNAGLLEEIGVFACVLSVQLAFSVYGIFTGYVLGKGITPLFLIVYGSLCGSFFLGPLAFWFERKTWPKRLSFKLLTQFVLISLGGVTLYQVLLLYGIQKSSPAVASTIPNVGPGIIFVIAWAFRFEKVNLKCIYSQVKILGTLLCIGGAITMSLLQSSGSTKDLTVVQSATMTISNDQIIGTFYVLAAIICFSCNVILQTATLADFLAPFSINCITGFIAGVFTAVIYFVQEHTLWVDSQLIDIKTLIGFIVLGVFLGGYCTTCNLWIIRKKGPVFMATFTPLGTVFSVILSALILKDRFTIGRFEKVNLKCIYSQVKILGTLLCIGGAITMSLLQSSGSTKDLTVVQSATMTINNDQIIGTFYVLAAVICFSCNVVLQAATLADFPAPFSINCITGFIAGVFTAVIYFVQGHTLWVDSQLIDIKTLIGFIVLGVFVGGHCTTCNLWIIRKKGPVFMATFTPWELSSV